MAGIFKRLKGRPKSSDGGTNPKLPLQLDINNTSISEQTVSDENKSDSLSPQTSDSDIAPQYPIAAGSLFSGLMLTKNTREQEPESSPYNKTVEEEETENDHAFSFLNQDLNPHESLRTEVSDDDPHSSFINEPGDTDPSENNEEEDKERDGKDTPSVGFSFLKEDTKKSNYDDIKLLDETYNEPSGFSFLSDTTKYSHEVDEEKTQSETLDQTQEPESDVKTTSVDISTKSETQLQSSCTPILPQTPMMDNTPSRSKVPQKVARQAPPSSSIKKKRLKATRPGQERNDEVVANLIEPIESSGLKELDAISISSHGSSVETITSSQLFYDGEKTGLESSSVRTLSSGSVTPVTTETPLGETISTEPNETSKQVLNDDIDTNIVPIDTTISTNVKTHEENLKQNSQISDDVIISEDLEKVFSIPPVEETETDSTTTIGNYEVQLSPLEKLEALVEVAKSNADKMRCDIEETEKQYGSVIEKNLSSLRQQIIRRQHIKDLKAKETVAIAEENYELADELNQELEAVEIRNESDLASETRNSVQEWVKQCSKLLSLEVSLQIEVQQQLTELKEEQVKCLISLEKDFSTTHTKEKMQLQTMRDKIERENGHIALDREHLEKRQQLLQDEVAQRAADFIACKKQLEEDENEVQLEIESLEKKLQLLKERKKELLERILEENEKIDSVEKELSSEQDQLNQEMTLLKKKENELQEQVVSLNEFQLSYDASVNLQNNQKQSVQSVIQNSEEKIEEYSQHQKALEKSISQDSELSFEDVVKVLKPSETLERLIEKEKSKDIEMKEITTKVLSLQSEISALSKRISDNERQLPKLQEAKKTAVAARQFREAAKISGEEKQLTSELEKEREEVAKMENTLSAENEILTELTQEFTNVREKRQKAEKEGDIEHIQQLLSLLLSLRTRQSRIPSKANSPTFKVLNLWCEFHELLIEDLCTKHDLPVNEYLTEEVLKSVELSVNYSEHISTENLNSAVEGKEEEDGSDDIEMIHNDRESPSEERTPGVGMEEPIEKKDEKEKEENEEVKEIKKNIEELEKRIADSCQEENFELAAELDEELDAMKKKLTDKLSNS